MKLFAIFIVFVTHFINRFDDSYFELWHQGPTSWILNGVTGKFGVAVFSVALGYFAFRSREQNISRYVIKRYIYFVICALFINTLYAVFGSAGVFEDTFTAREVIVTSLVLGSKIFRTFWCIMPFFAASVLSRLNGKANAGVLAVTAEMLIMIKLSGDVWISICLLGNLVSLAMDNDRIRRLMGHRLVRLLIYALIFILIKRPESRQAYCIDGICAAAAMLALSESVYIRKLLEWKPVSSLGRLTMAMYLVHVIIYRIAGGAMFGLTENMSAPYFFFTMLICWLLVVLISFPVDRLLSMLTKLLMKPADGAMSKWRDFFDGQRIKEET